ncbi:DUF3320 domain-containing protein [Afifella sp. YEN Y35]|uniref:DUF3320 domain-containing protein n=1 Tax=Afifella sp. YEN Y35 TaxID=3388337 RepID=UPI0039E0CB3C
MERTSAVEGAPLSDTGSTEIVVSADISPSFTYASYQNSVPVLRSLRLANRAPEPIENAELSLSASPPFVRRKTWKIDRIAGQDELAILERRVDLDADYLAGLNEAERGDITLRLTRGDETLAERIFPVRLLARDEWGGVADMAQILPAFVMPNDGAISKVLRAAAESLARHGHVSGMDGYQSGDPKRAYMLAAAIYSAVTGLGLHYALPPASFERRGQKVRRPSTVLAEGLATCLDTSLLFAAALEAAGLHPIIVLFADHATTGVWLRPRTLPHTVENDASEIRKAIAARELLVFETTGVTHRPPMMFNQACLSAGERLGEEHELSFVAAVDVARSRSSGVTPLASHERLTAKDAATEEPAGEVPLPPVPDFDAMPDKVEETPATPAGRIDRWQRKLLDLSLRNRLLNFVGSKSTVAFLCPDPAFLEDRLADGKAIRIISLPEQNPLGERDAELYREVRGKDIQREFALDALNRDEIASPLEPQSLEARLTTLYRQAKSDLAEGGANTLYMAVGFLRWKKKPEDERTYRAPLLLIPIKLERRSASSQFRLLHHEDDVRFNATLLQFLERDFDLKIPSLQGELPTDESGIDVPFVLELMRRAVRDVPGFEVVDETALATFSFAKFLMWKDLVERTDSLRQNRVVRHLIDTPEQPFSGDGTAFHPERDVDRVFAPADIVTPLPADSSQLVASIAAAEGKDFVLVGPPGTGKSQTIANMIANCLAKKKTVLFVAEKTAALDVVYRRLREHGLAHRCLELHSSNADRRHFLSQLRDAWESGKAGAASKWIELNDRLRIRRDELNAYVDALHRQAANGLTPYLAMGRTLRGKTRYAPALHWPSKDAHDRESLLELEDLAAELGRTFAEVEYRPSLAFLDIEEWSSAWEDKMLAASRICRDATDDLLEALGRLRHELGLDAVEDADRTSLESYAEFARHIGKSAEGDYAIALDREFERIQAAMDELERALQSYVSDAGALSAIFEREELGRIPVDTIEQDWRQAKASNWPLSWLRRRKCRKLLQTYARSGKVDPENDLPLIRRMQHSAAAIAQSPLVVERSHFAGLDTDTSKLRAHLEAARQLRRAFLGLLRTVGEMKTVVESVAPIIYGRREGDTLIRAAARFLERHAAFLSAEAEFAAAAGQRPTDLEATPSLASISKAIREIEESRPLLRNWSSWCSVRNRAIAHGLQPFVADLGKGLIEPHDMRGIFRLAYARWWLPLAIDDDATLRSFRRFQHEHAIDDFRELDDLVRKAASTRVVKAVEHDLPAAHTVPRKSELGHLRHQLELKRPSRSIREMIGKMPESFGRLAPCVLMSPLSIAQYLPPDQALFDVVIFDEASQITTWDAVGAVARGRQTIIVGDPKQLPPTNFFGRNEADDADLEEYEKDLESILDEARACGLPIHDLRWHYRSRHESLIAFSNWNYYQNRLITFPSPVTEDRAVSFRHVPDAVYDRGKSRTNEKEARAIAREVAARLKDWLRLPESERPTIGVITFNSQQQALILDFLDDERRADDEIEWFFADDRVEPVFVKNLENVQGDERDVILFSITFCKDAAGKLSVDFGAINREGGERRLNVAVTRARQELLVFAGITADQIDLSRTKAAGVHHLKAFLDYAQRGAVALPAVETGSQGELESPFEQEVAEELRNRGWHVVPQVGVSGFRVDIAVKHPERPGAYLAGIECDGATYHRSATARDRDKVREQVLRGLGWEIIRVWSTDWWFDRTEAASRLHDALEELLARQPAPIPEPSETAHWEMAETEGAMREPLVASAISVMTEERPADLSDVASDDADRFAGAATPQESLFAGPDAARETGEPLFHVADLSVFDADPNRFFDFDYRGELQAMVDAVLEAEAPVREDILMQRIARAHGWLRTGRRIREQITKHLKTQMRTEEDDVPFLWKTEISQRVPYRAPAGPEHRRAVPEISLAELADLILADPAVFAEVDPALALARTIGVDRLSASSRTRLDKALQHAQRLGTGGSQVDP